MLALRRTAAIPDHPATGPEVVRAEPVRPTVRGKFLYLGKRKHYVRGVTYGTFRPDAQGAEFPARERVDADFALMAAHGINAVRTYTPPPRWLLDSARDHGLHVMVGLAVERSAAFIDYSRCTRAIRTALRAEIRAVAGHPAILCYAIGNEIPASVVRWHGRQRVERFLEDLYETAKAEDPGGLVTYVNYPSTEYLRLPFLDLVAFNVYLESRARFQAYLARLHNIAGDRPLLMAELGLDSLRHGENGQAASLDWQIRSSFAGGCAGLFVYAWTDEWYRGGGEVDDWRFGITDRARAPKQALSVVERAFAAAPFPADVAWPRISVIVCTYNGSRTIAQCCKAIRSLEYPDFEVIVVDDGSTDGSGDIAAGFGFRVLRTPNRGLSSARNTGLEAATGEIVAYTDDDAYPDPHWLHYLAQTFMDPARQNHAGVGGPNIPPPGDGFVAQCVARAPGGPSHVLLSDRLAEHIPGCNMAFRAARLRAIGGFDPQFRVAGDDVDVCWRLQEQGWTLGFSPAAVVWHHRRNSILTYLKQQRGYGRAEAMLERKWPEKYNAAGHATWRGRVYNGTAAYPHWRGDRIYHGVWGLAPFQFLYEPAPTLVESLPLMPEWYLVVACLALLSVLGAFWTPLTVNRPLLLFSVAAPVIQATRCAARLTVRTVPGSRMSRWTIRLVTAGLHLLQPLARLYGRLRHGLTLWRRRCAGHLMAPKSWTADVWTPRAQPAEERLASMETRLRSRGLVPRRGSDYDRWDLSVGGGILGSARLSLAAEFHGDGRQLLRIRSWPRFSTAALMLVSLFSILSAGAALDRSWPTAAILGLLALVLAYRAIRESGASMAGFLDVVTEMRLEDEGSDDHV